MAKKGAVGPIKSQKKPDPYPSAAKAWATQGIPGPKAPSKPQPRTPLHKPQPPTFAPSATPSLTAGLPSPETGGNVSWQDSLYAEQQAQIQRNLANLKSYLLDQGNQAGLDYGVSYDRDPTDPFKLNNLRIDENVDVTNPFSKAALLKRSYKQAEQGNTTGYAAKGQLYSGALQNAQNNAGWQNQQGQDSLLKGLSSQYGGLYQQYLGAQANAGQQSLDAQAAAIARAQAAAANSPTVSPVGLPGRPISGYSAADYGSYAPLAGPQGELVGLSGLQKAAVALASKIAGKPMDASSQLAQMIAANPKKYGLA